MCKFFYVLKESYWNGRWAYQKCCNKFYSLLWGGGGVGGFLNNLQIEGFPANWELVFFFFLNFSHGIYSMYVPESMCIVILTENPSGPGELFYPQQWTYDSQEWCTNSIKLSIHLKNRREWRIWWRTFSVQWLFKKVINYGDLGTFTSSSLFSNSTNLRSKISNKLFHCRTQCFFWGEGGQKEPQKGF